MQETKYTFLLPAYKAKYFAEALTSIKNQVYKDFIVLVSDDCSPEDLKSIYDSTVGDDPRFSYRRNAENMGSKSLVSHWNLLVEMCDTDYLIMASDDDVYEPNFLEEIDELVGKYPEVDLFRGEVQKINERGRICDLDQRYGEFEIQQDFLYNTFCGKRIMCIANYVFKTLSLKAIKNFRNFPLAWNSDDATIMQMSKNGVCNTNSIVFSFRSSGLNISDSDTLLIKATKVRADLQYAEFFEIFCSSVNESEKTENFCLFEKQIRQSLANILSQMVHLLPYREMKVAYQYLRKGKYIKTNKQTLDFIWYWLKNRKFCAR